MAPGQQVSSRVLTVPNVISFLRLLLVPVFALLIVAGHDVWALVVLAVSGASDWLDGVLARRLDQVSRVGQMLDPAADRLFILVTLLGLAWRDIIPVWLVVVIVARDVLLAGLLPWLARHGYGPLPVSLAGKAGTFALLYAFPLLLLAGAPGWLGDVAAVTGWAFTWWGIGLYWLAGAQYVVQARALVAADRRAGPASARTPGRQAS
ncbi:CDP-alcohol phosphatidyltransferase family protein [Cellulosimicrobium marinum]|uniref:CDP-alcohol phosphatidyltransferase family protein n=1 Tax=Cellulosimicrobium marinum TaxID=1638992 RepID=UPI001E54D5F4|nr:CDP-alcohol phosphatidyltransferase family protein [Cellulosimicrobium marinum]MCB7137542.1 CDP-alcohol phosphatidyltransferase family protein [Cellulosimicrobium marinum]